MKKFILTSLILFAGFFIVNLQAQTVPVLIQGQVTDVVTGAPIANHSVHITTDSTSPAFYYFNTVITDNAGHYSDVVNVPPNSQILFFIFTIDCNGMRHDAFGVSTNAPIINNFSICGTAGPQCHADFYVVPDSLTQYSFHFIDVSLPFPDTWAWDFGDGTTSTLQNPTHTYNAPGPYVICLTISKGVPGTISFCTDTYCDNVIVDTLPNPCYNNFTFTINNLIVNFSGMANPPNSTYSWDFGDGAVGTGQNVSHTYAGPGLYPVTLTTSSFIGCTFTSFQMVQLGGPGICDPMFMVMPVPGNSMTFDFIDISMGYPMSWSWDFGDGTTSTLQNPTHTYNAPGPYVICLTIVCDPNTQPSTYCDSIFVNGNPTGCNAKFYVYPDSTTNFAYYFQDASSPIPPDTWAWDFGDGTTANIPYPYHVFNAPGVYNVCLTITKGAPGTPNFCTDTYCKNVIVDTLPGPCHNDFQYLQVNNLTVDFFGMAIPPSSSYTWDFGDNTVGTGQNVSHTYAAPGMYPVTLVTSDFLTGCSFTSTKMVLVSGNPSNCHAMFFHHPDSLNQLGFHFIDVSTPIPDTWAWDFGDGTTANIPNPYHVYSAPGVYHVCLTITKGTPGTISFCTDTYCENVFVNSNPTGGKIHGTITMGFGFADHARVFLIVFDPVANTLTAIDTVYTQNNPMMPGYYEFLNVQPGTYLVKAALTPNSVSYADFMPTYYINTLWWDYGSDVIVNNQWVIADINLIAGSNPGGPGFIGGNVTQGANKLLGPGDAIPDVEILLLSMNDDPHLYTYSDVNGDYGFNNLAYGTYKIWAEVLDKTTIPVIVTIDANNPSITNIDLIVTSTGVTTSIDDNISAFVENVSDIYPNPVNDEMNVEVSLKQSSELQFEVFNQIGQVVYSKIVSESAGQHLVKINTSDFDGGVYSLRITTKDKAQIMRKFVKVN